MTTASIASHVNVLTASPFCAAGTSLAGGGLLVWAVLSILKSEVGLTLRASSRGERVVLVLLLLVAVVHVVIGQRPELSLVPDSVEYAVGALNWITDGRYEIVVSGISHPPRYPIGLSLFGIAPWMALVPSLRVAILPIFFSEVICLIAAAAIGRRCGAHGAIALSPALLFLIPNFHQEATTVATQLPAMALTAAVLVGFLQWQENQRRTLPWGPFVLIAFGCLMRPLLVFLFLPWIVASLFRAPQRGVVIAIACVFCGISVGCTLSYDLFVFGDPLRNGYKYWCSIPYDVPDLVFSSRYIGSNLLALLGEGALSFMGIVAALLILAAFVLKRDEKGDAITWSFFQSSLSFFVIGILPVSVAHLFYFYASSVFHIEAFVWGAIIGGCAGAVVLRLERLKEVRHFLSPALALGALSLALAFMYRAAKSDPSRYSVAEEIREYSKSGDLVVTALDPVYLSLSLPDGVTAVPISRRVEYASKFVSPQRVRPSAALIQGPLDHRNESLRHFGAYDAVANVLLDEKGGVDFSSGPSGRILIDLSFLTPFEIEIIGKHYRLDKVSLHLSHASPLPQVD